MEQEIQGNLEKNGFEVENTLERFMNNEELYKKFMKKLLEDQNYENLVEAIKEKDYADAFVHAHTLKGVLANLGLEGPLAKLLPVVKKLRGAQGMAIAYGSVQTGSTGILGNEEDFQRDVENFSLKYEKTCKIIETYF